MEQRQTGLFAGTATFFFSSLLVYAARFATSVIVARTLGVEGKGIYTLVLMLGSLLSLFLSFGFSGSITYLTASKQFSSKALYSFSIIASIILSVAGGIIFFIAYNRFFSQGFLTGTDVAQIMLVLLLLPVNLATLFLSSIIQGKQQLLAFNFINILRVLSNLGLQIISSLLHGGVMGAILAWAISNIVAFLVVLWFLRADITIKLKYPAGIIRPAVSFGSKNYIANLFTFFNYRLDSFLVNFYLGPTSVGLYSVGVSTAELIWYIPNAISNALFPKSSTLENHVAARLTAQACRQTLFVAAILTLLFAIIGPLLIPWIYGADFQASVPAFLWLLPGILGVSLSKIISANLSGLGKPQYATYTSTVTVVLTIVLDILLIPPLGIVGAAIASSISYLCSAMISVIWFNRETQIRWIDVILPKPSDLSILAKRATLIVSSRGK